MMGTDVRLKEILDLPVVPPGRMTRGAIRVRARVLRLHRGMAPPAVRVLEALFGLFDNRVLGLLVELELPELLQQPRSAAELAALTGTDADALERVLRFAAGRGFLDEHRRHRYSANGVTNVLTREHPNSWRGWVEFASSDWFWQAWRAMRSSLQPAGTSAMEAATGSTFFEYVTKDDPAAGDAFDRAMEAGATMQALALDRALDWKGARTVCDVGGGTGAALRILLRAHDHLEGVLTDLPEVVAKAQGMERLRVVPGDFFNEVPPGCDRYLMLAIIHDWDDDEAAKILRNVGRAMGTEGRAFVVENELADLARGDFAEASDLLMRVLGSGRERTRKDFHKLFAAAGMKLEKVHILPTGFSAFELSLGSGSGT